MPCKIILIYPSLLYGNASNALMILPLSLIYIATPLKERYDIVMIDQRIDPAWRSTLKRELSGGPVVCVGISTMTGPQIAGALEAASMVKEHVPSVPVVWGGVHPSLTPEQTIRDERVDVLVVGDGEETFEELVETLRRGGDKRSIRGIVFKEDGTVVHTPPRKQFSVAKMLLPAYDLVDVGRYRIDSMWGTGDSLPVLTKQGLPTAVRLLLQHPLFKKALDGAHCGTGGGHDRNACGGSTKKGTSSSLTTTFL